jgi:sugar phosphate isomerase/epimerase
VRDFCKTIDDFDKTLKRIAEIGYRGVQYSPWGGLGAAAVREAADKHGLEIVVTHYPPKRLLDDPVTAMDEHRVLGTKLIGMGAMPDEYRADKSSVLRFIADYAPVIDELHKNGFRFMYHNHDFEFEKIGGKLILDYITEAFPPEKAGIILDLFWVQAGGGDPADWLMRLRGRVECVHYKDFSIIGRQRKPSPVMEGNMNWKLIFAASRAAGVEWAFVEQEEFNGGCAFDCLRISYENLVKAGFA